MAEEEPEPVVPEVTVDALKQALAHSNPPLVLDVREPYEWRQVRMTFAQHIPMNEVPQHTDELRGKVAARPHAAPAVVVVCAHGSRSYGVAAYLNEQGVSAASLAGGITQWSIQGGEVAQGG
jgi:rhodanese-related sulfurtransferase